MADIKKIKLTDGKSYNVIDATAIHETDVATSKSAGIVKIGSGITVAADGTISVNVTAPVTSVNSKTGAVVLSASDVGAVPTTRTVNGKALSSNITLSASDVGALPDTTEIPSKTSDLTNDSGFLTSAPVTSVNSKTGAVTLTKSDVSLGNVDNVKQYSASNPPPYPVTSVNGQTGAITIDSGGTNIIVSATQPTGQKAGDFWFQIVN